MCGIVGYVGSREAEPILIEGLRRLEYRGYDSAGIATITGDRLHLRKRAGRVGDLVEHLRSHPAPGCHGIAHTRWATHGPATDVNAHPHLGRHGDSIVAVVHNGVIENYAPLKRQLQKKASQFTSDTDTEVIAQLLAFHLNGDLVEADAKGIAAPQGHLRSRRNQPAQSGSDGRAPGSAVRWCSAWATARISWRRDPSALVGHTDRVVYLQDGQVGVVAADEFHVLDPVARARRRPASNRFRLGRRRSRQGRPSSITCSRRFTSSPRPSKTRCAADLCDADASAHFGGLNLDPQQLRRIDRIILTACGTSYHAALVGEYLIEEFARIPVEVEYASEFRYRNPPIDQNTIVIAITQSGETADTLAAVRESQAEGPSDAGHLQRRRLDDRPRSRRRRLPARRAGNRRGQHQGVHIAGD